MAASANAFERPGRMYELVVIACLLAEPAKCEEFYLSFERPTTAMQCLRGGQPRLARWIEQKPDWVIRKWTCGLPRA